MEKTYQLTEFRFKLKIWSLQLNLLRNWKELTIIIKMSIKDVSDDWALEMYCFTVEFGLIMLSISIRCDLTALCICVLKYSKSFT